MTKTNSLGFNLTFELVHGPSLLNLTKKQKFKVCKVGDDIDLDHDTDEDDDIDLYNLDNETDEDDDIDLDNDTDRNDDIDLDNNLDNDTDDRITDFSHLWVLCDFCYGQNYKDFFPAKLNICEWCGSHLKMGSPERIELLIDTNTWEGMDEDMVSVDPIEFYSMEGDYTESYKDRIDSHQNNTGLTEAVQTGIGKLNGISIAIGIMDFEFIAGSMGSVVGEKITRLIEYAINESLPLIMVCASGGARMQEGSLSLVQMAKISSASYDYYHHKELLYVSILTSPTTGGVTASFGMLGELIIAEPDATIAFAGKRVIEETLKVEVPEGVQESEYLFEMGAFDLLIPRNLLKSILSEVFEFLGFVPENSIKYLPLPWNDPDINNDLENEIFFYQVDH
uniref:acetyl-CoA carboxylase carboxyltransferase beta subunit n=1 Tax=Ranunculus testiculatus TaxID=3158765 RepID=UPI0022FD616A|nr:acetyl-CoA carboxylase carboxyltransferase beta subunit [Ceratocephala testiculata]WAL35625.1 acetyl-CoA carboxylase carboxyltransferase beta subunit [Ceratocephala testiculata]